MASVTADAGIDLDAQRFGLLAEPAAEAAEAADIAAVIAHQRRHQESGDADAARLAEIIEAVLGDLVCERRALLAPVRQEPVERDGIDHRAGQDMRADLGALLQHDDGDLLAGLGRELLEPDRRGEPRGARADDHDVELHGLALDDFVQSVMLQVRGFGPMGLAGQGLLCHSRVKRESSIQHIWGSRGN